MSTLIENVNRIYTDKEAIKQAIVAKDVTVPDGTSLDEYAELIAQINSGVDTGDATAIAADILLGKTAYVRGEKITGTLEIQTDSIYKKALEYYLKITEISNVPTDIVFLEKGTAEYKTLFEIEPASSAIKSNIVNRMDAVISKTIPNSYFKAEITNDIFISNRYEPEYEENPVWYENPYLADYPAYDRETFEEGSKNWSIPYKVKMNTQFSKQESVYICGCYLGYSYCKNEDASISGGFINVLSQKNLVIVIT